MTDRIDLNELGVDDVVISNVDIFRLERMNDETFWLRLYLRGRPDVVFSLYAKDGKILVRQDEP